MRHAAARWSRDLRRTPAYAHLRRALVLRLRRSTIGRRVALGVYADLLEPAEVRTLLARERRAASDQQAADRDEHERQVARLRQTHTADLARQRDQHRGVLSRKLADIDRDRERRHRAVPAVSAGDLVAGLYLGDRPLVVFDVRGVDPATAEVMLDEIACEQVLGCSFRPMFLSDLEDTSVWSRYGHLCERVPPEQGWSGVTPYADYLAARWESLRDGLGAGWILTVPPTGLTDVQRAFVRRCGR